MGIISGCPGTAIFRWRGMDPFRQIKTFLIVASLLWPLRLLISIRSWKGMWNRGVDCSNRWRSALIGRGHSPDHCKHRVPTPGFAHQRCHRPPGTDRKRVESLSPEGQRWCCGYARFRVGGRPVRARASTPGGTSCGGSGVIVPNRSVASRLGQHPAGSLGGALTPIGVALWPDAGLREPASGFLLTVRDRGVTPRGWFFR
jgi:hypothetical protein